MREWISNRQLLIVLILVKLATSTVYLEPVSSGYAKADAWLSVILSIAGGVALTVFAYTGAKSWYVAQNDRPKGLKNLFYWLAVLAFAAYCYLQTVIAGRQFVDFWTTNLYIEYSPSMFLIAMSILIFAALWMGLAAASRSMEFLFPFILFSLLFAAFNANGYHPEYLFPVLKDGWTPVTKGAIQPTASFGQFTILMVLYPFVFKKKEALKDTIMAVLVSGSMLLMTTLATLMVLGPEESVRHLFPAYALARHNRLEGVFSVIATFWIATTFTKSYVHAFGLLFILKLLSEKIPLVPAAFCISLSTTLGVYYSYVIWSQIVFGSLISNTFPVLFLAVQILVPVVFVLLARGKKETCP